MQPTHRADLSQLKLARGTTELAEKRKFRLHYLKFNLRAGIRAIRAIAACVSASGTRIVRQINREARCLAILLNKTARSR
jgi:hypothetical protein